MASPLYEFRLVESADLTDLGPIGQARDRQVTIVHNAPGSISFNVPVTDQLWQDIEPIRHGIMVYRNGLCLWSGYIWTMSDDMPGLGGKIAVTATGWFETLNHRILRQDVNYPRYDSPPLTITGGEIVFANPFGADPTDDTYWPGGLLTIANAQQDTWITEGASTDKMNRLISYQRGQNIGEAIKSLTSIEAGFDFYVNPLTRVMTISNWDEYDDISDEVIFGYNWGPNNLVDFGRELDASVLCNRDTAFGNQGGGMAEDTESQQRYQLFEEMTQLSDVVDPNVLLAFAGGEVALRSVPRTTYNLQPFPTAAGRSPAPFDDYNVGDVVAFSAVKEPRLSVEQQKVRIFGMTVGITNEGNEKLQALQITPSE
jgi:hypothetical protein